MDGTQDACTVREEGKEEGGGSHIAAGTLPRPADSFRRNDEQISHAFRWLVERAISSELSKMPFYCCVPCKLKIDRLISFRYCFGMAF